MTAHVHAQAASLRPRVLAFALDYIQIAAYATVLAAVTFVAAASPLQRTLAVLLATPASRDAVAFVTVVLPVILYFALQEGSARQATWGKRKLGLRVTGLDGGQLSLGRALVRSGAKFLPWQIPHLPVPHPRLAAGASRAAGLGAGGLRPGVAAGDHLPGAAGVQPIPSHPLRPVGRLAGDTNVSEATVSRSIALVTLVVRDYDDAIAFFTEALRFVVSEDTPLGDGKRWVVVAPPEGCGAALLLARAAAPEQTARVGNQTGGRVALFLHTADFWADYDHMLAHGVRFAEQPREERYDWVVVFHDLYGNKWDLVQPRDHDPLPAQHDKRNSHAPNNLSS